MRLKKKYLAPIFIPAKFENKSFVIKGGKSQRSSEYRECIGVELVGGQLREDDELYKLIRRKNLVNE